MSCCKFVVADPPSRMCSIRLIIHFIFVTQALGKSYPNKLSGKFVSKLVKRALKLWPFYHANLGSTTLRKYSNLVYSRSNSNLFLPTYLHSSRPHGIPGSQSVSLRLVHIAAESSPYSVVPLWKLKQRAEELGLAIEDMAERKSLEAAVAQAEALQAQKESSSAPLRELEELAEVNIVTAGSLDHKNIQKAEAKGIAHLMPQQMRVQTNTITAPIHWDRAASLSAGMKSQPWEFAALKLQTARGDTALMIVDTAASMTLLSPEASVALGCQRTGVDIGVSIVGTGEKPMSCQVAMGELSLPGSGSLSLLPQLNALVMPLPTGEGISGILGLNFLNTFDAVELNWEQRPGEMQFMMGGQRTMESWVSLTTGLSEIVLQPIGMGLLTAVVQIDGKITMPGLLDTGAAFSTLNSAAAELLGFTGDSSVEPMWVAGADGKPIAMQIAERDVTVTIGNTKVTDCVRPLLGEMAGFSAFGLGKGPAMLLGLDVLVCRPRIVLSTATRRLFL